MRLAAAVLATIALAAGMPAAAQGLSDAAALRVEPEATEGPPTPPARGKGRASRAAQVDLPPPSPAELALIEPARKSGAPMKIGFPRPIPALQEEGATGRSLEWETLADDTRVAAVTVTSPGAAALRLGLRIVDLPAAAVLRFHDPAGEQLFEVTGAEVLAAIEANLAAGERGPDARTYWSPVVEAPAIVMEIELPAGSRPSELRMAVPLLSHLVASAKSGFSIAKVSAACEKDAMCQIGTWGAQMNAVARMVFSSGGYSYLCSGTLLADTDTSTTIPYFLSANHCIGSQSVASSLTTYWFWRSTACDSGIRGAYSTLQGGAALLYQSTATDVSFMRLNGTPPAGVSYAGWMANTGLGMYATVTGLHHPTGDLLKISAGRVLGYLNCSPPTSGQFSCSQASASSSNFYDIGWTSGVVEGGSSGSAIFDSGKYVVGQLYGGGSSCSDPGAGDSYGRFDVSFNAALSTWLNPPPPSPQTLTVSKGGAGSGSVASSPAGIACGATCSASFAYGSTVSLVATPSSAASRFAGWGGACTGIAGCNIGMTSAAAVTAYFVPSLVTQSATSLAFGSFQASQTVTLTNDTGATVTFQGYGLDSARFGQANNCTTLAAGASCTVTVTYYPGIDAPLTGTLTIASSAPNSPHVVSLSGGPNLSTRGTRLYGISARMMVQTGNDVMIAGFLIGGSAAKTVIVRARGPSLAAQGVANALANPRLELVRASDQTLIAANDDWGGAPNSAAIAASGFAPANALESAILITLAPGAYTATVSGVANATGVGIVEVYEIAQPDVPLTGISTRGQVLGGNDVMIGGFVIQGPGPQTVVVRARGPSLAPLGVSNALSDPSMEVVRASDGALMAANDNWVSAANATTIQASGYAPSSGLESAALMSLAPGAYTVVVRGVGGATGVGIFEVYSLP